MSELCWSLICEDAGSAGGARADARRYLELHADPAHSDLDDAEQIVGELVANVFLHGASPFGMHIDWREERPTLSVRDSGLRTKLLYAVPDWDAERGRGLLIVRALGGAFVLEGPNDEHTGMRVVVELPVCRVARAAA
jgi:anti-sigma regulatory factor (Ser/Thr protein kinase)